MDNFNDGGPAFPRGHVTGWEGMSLRDWFAGQIAATAVKGCLVDSGFIDVARVAYQMADAMLIVREEHK